MDNKKFNIRNIIYVIITALTCFILAVAGYSNSHNYQNTISNNIVENKVNNEINIKDISQIPEYTGELIIKINNGIPNFKESDFNSDFFIQLSDTDEKGRVQVAYANLSYDNMPSKDTHRESMSNVYTTGWSDKKYEFLTDNENEINLYNKSHLIAFSLIGNCGKDLYKNLFTGTHDLNKKGMTRYENDITAYLKKNPDKHVLYRVTPVFDEDNLLATGVQMEAASVEDKGESLHFNVFVYNVQDGIYIDYKTGENSAK